MGVLRQLCGNVMRNPSSIVRHFWSAAFDGQHTAASTITRASFFISLPNVQDEPRPWLARAVLLGARIVTAMVVGSGALFGFFFIPGISVAWAQFSFSH